MHGTTIESPRMNLHQALADESTKPALCFTADTKLRAGIKPDLNHPIAPNKVILFLGDRTYVPLDYHRRPLYRMTDGKAQVLRAKIGSVTLEGGRTFRTIQKVDADEKIETVLVHIMFGLGEGVQLRPGIEPLMCEVRGGKNVATGETEALIEVKRSDVLTVLYQDGSVSCFNLENLSVGEMLPRLKPEGALRQRLATLEMKISDAHISENGKRDSGVIRKVLQELARMIRLTKSAPELRGVIVRQVASVVKNQFDGELDKGLRKEFEHALRFVDDRNNYWWMKKAEYRNATAIEMPPAHVVETRTFRKSGAAGLWQALEYAMASGNPSDWEQLKNRLVAAAERGDLSVGLQKKFCLQCPVNEHGWSDIVSKLPATARERENKRSPLKANKKELTPEERKQNLKKLEARRTKNRQERLAGRPEKGSSPAADSGHKRKRNEDRKK